MATKTRVQVWERRPAESPRAFEAFSRYRDSGTSRSLNATDKAWPNRGPVSPSLSRFKKWSADHEWVERCRVWDAHVQAEKDRETVRAAVEWARRQEKRREEMYLISTELLDRAKMLLKMPVVKTTVEKENGRTLITIEPARWALRDIGPLAKLAFDLGHQAIHGYGSPIPGTDEAYRADVSGGLSPEMIEVARAAIARAGLGLDAE